MALTELPDASDVIVVGGGIMGTATTYFLATETDAEVTLLEKEAIASGSTGDSSAILRHHYDDRAIYSRMAWWGHQFYRNFEEHTGEAIAYGRSPMVRFADEKAKGPVLAGYRILDELDIPVSRFEGEELARQYPMILTDPFDIAVSDDAAGFSDGTDAAAGFARSAADRGATVVTNVEVTGVRTDEGAVSGLETDAGPISCESVVFAAGPWTARLLEPLGVEIPLRITREQVLLLDPPEAYLEKYPEVVPTSGAEEGWYLRRDFGDGVLLATHHTDEEVDPDHYDTNPDEETILELLAGIEGFVPELAASDIKGQYCGVYSTTPDRGFVLDEVGVDRCFVACGFSGHGFKHGPTVGKIMADLVDRGETDLVDVDRFSLDRF